MEYEFTRNLEARLDDIAAGRDDYLTVMWDNDEVLAKELKNFALAYAHFCPNCGKILRHLFKAKAPGRKGYDFWSCSGYPDCKTAYGNLDGKPDLKPKPSQDAA